MNRKTGEELHLFLSTTKAEALGHSWNGDCTWTQVHGKGKF